MSERELRLALGMRGGVSLAVWIGGACAEIDTLRRAAPDDESSSFWDRVLGVSDYHRVVVDVLAGASAGGLNGVMFASSLVYDYPFDDAREIWLDAGNTETLLRTRGPYVSLFDGDGVFLARVDQFLRAMVEGTAGQDHGHGVERVTLSLSATLIEPIERLGASPEDEEEWERRSASGFHFEHHPEPWRGSDFPPGDTGDTEPRRRALARLAVAARATSSFPAAFEPAVVNSARPARFSDVHRGGTASIPGAAALDAPGDVDLAGTFLDRRTDGSFLVADGGILDNIPLARAVRDITAAPAGGPTRRVLLYLHPGAPARHVAAPAPAGVARRAMPALARGIVQAFRTEETIAQDIGELERHAQLVDRARGVRGATFTPLTVADPIPPRARFDAAAADARSSYVEQRGVEDAQSLLALLMDPMAALGSDPFPQGVAGGNESMTEEQWRSPLGRLRSAERNVLALALWDRCRHATSTDLMRFGDGPVHRVARVLLDWTWSLEARGADVGSEKQALYRIVNFVDEVLEPPRQWAWVAAAAVAFAPPASIDPTDFVDRCMQWTDALYRLRRGSDAQVLRDALVGTDDEPITAFRTQVFATLDEVVAGVVGSGAPATLEASDDVRSAVLYAALIEIAERLRTTPVDQPDVFHPGALIHRCLAGDDPVTAETLEHLELLCYPEFVTGAPCQSEIEFHRLSAANRFPLAPRFRGLLDAATATGKWWDPEITDPAAQRGIHVDLKLAGNELGNFAAFLLPEWRANDWLWGRLDAVPTLVDLLVTPATLRAHHISGENALERLRALATPSAAGDATECMAAFFDERLDAVTAELSRLAASEDADVDISNIRDVLVACRQWEILDDELRKPRHATNAASPPRSGTLPLVRDAGGGREAVTLTTAVATYDVGAQTTSHPEGSDQAADRAAALHDRFAELTDRGSEVVLDNLDARQGGPVPAAVLSPKRRRFVLRILRFVAALATRPLLPARQSGHRNRTKVALVVGVAAVVAAIVYAVSRDLTAFLIGLALPVVLGAVLVYLTRPRGP
jgi:patatin-related protein